MPDALDGFTVELARCVERLRAMPLPRLPRAEEPVREAMAALAGSPVPRLEPRALGDQLQVVATEAARGRDFDPAAAEALLADLRRALP